MRVRWFRCARSGRSSRRCAAAWAAEIAADALLQVAGLADVEQVAGAAGHAVDARQVLRPATRPLPSNAGSSCIGRLSPGSRASASAGAVAGLRSLHKRPSMCDRAHAPGDARAPRSAPVRLCRRLIGAVRPRRIPTYPWMKPAAKAVSRCRHWNIQGSLRQPGAARHADECRAVTPACAPDPRHPAYARTTGRLRERAHDLDEALRRFRERRAELKSAHEDAAAKAAAGLPSGSRGGRPRGRSATAVSASAWARHSPASERAAAGWRRVHRDSGRTRGRADRRAESPGRCRRQGPRSGWAALVAGAAGVAGGRAGMLEVAPSTRASAPSGRAWRWPRIVTSAVVAQMAPTRMPMTRTTRKRMARPRAGPRSVPLKVDRAGAMHGQRFQAVRMNRPPANLPSPSSALPRHRAPVWCRRGGAPRPCPRRRDRRRRRRLVGSRGTGAQRRRPAHRDRCRRGLRQQRQSPAPCDRGQFRLAEGRGHGGARARDQSAHRDRRGGRIPHAGQSRSAAWRGLRPRHRCLRCLPREGRDDRLVPAAQAATCRHRLGRWCVADPRARARSFRTKRRPALRSCARLRENSAFRAGRSYSGIPAVYSLENVRYPQADGSVCGTRPAGADGGFRLDCGSGLGAATHLTATFAFAAVARALERLLAAGPAPPSDPE